ncbi:putative ABC transporter, membrane protein [Nocardia neocaledoniensis NBRC 108232]|uniref:ABC-2 type transport system permease protein n=1 Tax=Nocardia neocaledoniensis TaxID=236511 RepID=A0A317NDN2_9NOCA|nr:ABC transporter permease [Nocardia neocaledoniensis]PWV73411.1 ABC-2 type transport system permease protein [Nocardia neocaledoniensis]GEM29968.1 putative ABC transporter, membrane protein [Nocardia neocaledoniensis NBRC 108232]
MGVLAAERIKLTSTRSPWWCSAVVVLLSVGLAALMALITNIDAEPGQGPPPLTPALAASGVAGFGVMVLMIMAALTVTSEYRFGVIRSSFLAVPNRSKVIVSKAGLVGVYAAVLTGVLALVAFVVAKVIVGDEAPMLVLDGNWRAIYGIPIYAFLCVLLAIGVGVLVRQAAAAISLIVLWPLLIEGLLGAFGSFGRAVNPFLPFANANRFLTTEEVSGNWHWGVWGSLIYFAVFVAIVFAGALVVVNRRDA